MALITTIAGAYTATYNPSSGGSGGAGAVAQGICTDEGFNLGWTVHKQRVNRTDQYAQSLLDSIYQGADWDLMYVCREYAVGNINAAWPYGKVSALLPLSVKMGVIARRDSDVEGSVVLTSTTGTPAVAAPATLTAAHVAAADGKSSRLQFTSRTREVPVHLVVYPYTSSSDVVWFVTT